MVVVDSVPNIQYTQYADRDVRLKGNARQAQPVNAAKPLRNPPEFRLQRKERAGGKTSAGGKNRFGKSENKKWENDGKNSPRTDR